MNIISISVIILFGLCWFIGIKLILIFYCNKKIEYVLNVGLEPTTPGS